MNKEYCGLLINGRPLSDFGGQMLLDYSIGETPLDNSVFQGVNRTSWHLLKTIFGRRSISMTIVFTGEDLHDAKLKRSMFNAECFGKAELFISDDGFFYTVSCDSLGSEVVEGIGDKTASVKSTYKFTGIRHGPLEKETIQAGGGSMLCRSTMPFTDAKLTTTVGSSSSSYSFGGATWANVSAGDVLVFDGINGKLTRNGSNYAQNVRWTDFPRLTPGKNTLTATDAISVEYYPAFL